MSQTTKLLLAHWQRQFPASTANCVHKHSLVAMHKTPRVHCTDCTVQAITGPTRQAVQCNA